MLCFGLLKPGIEDVLAVGLVKASGVGGSRSCQSSRKWKEDSI